MVYLLFGDDDFLVHEELARIRAGLGPEDMVSLNTTCLVGEGLTLPELQAVCDAVPFLAPARLVIVEGLLSRFNAAPVARRGPRQARSAPVAEAEPPRDSGDETGATLAPAPQQTAPEGLAGGWAQLASYCRRMPETTALVLLDGPVRRNNPLLALLAPVAQVREQQRLRGAALERWVRERAARLGSLVTPSAMRLLLEVVGDNLWVLSSEMEKLSLYANGQPVQPEHVQDVVASARELSIFSLVDAVAEGRLQGAQRALQHLLRDGLAPPYILFMLARQFRLLLLAKFLLERGITGPALMRRLGIAAEYPFRKTVEQSGRYTVPALEAALRRLLEADVAMKTGELGPEMALELLVIYLCRATP